MPFCLKCVPFSCDNAKGIISLEWSTRGSLTYMPNDCDIPGGGTGAAGNDDYILGPTLGNVALTAYAFTENSDRWLGSRCLAQVQGSQSVIQKYDLKTEKYYLIPSKNNTGQISGDISTAYAKLGQIKCTTTTYKSVLMNGATVATELETQLGGELEYNGYPIKFSFPIEDHAFDFSFGSDGGGGGRTPTLPSRRETVSIFGSTGTGTSSQKSFLTNFNLNVNFPEPAVANYTFQFILDC